MVTTGAEIPILNGVSSAAVAACADALRALSATASRSQFDRIEKVQIHMTLSWVIVISFVMSWRGKGRRLDCYSGWSPPPPSPGRAGPVNGSGHHVYP